MRPSNWNNAARGGDCIRSNGAWSHVSRRGRPVPAGRVRRRDPRSGAQLPGAHGRPDDPRTRRGRRRGHEPRPAVQPDPLRPVRDVVRAPGRRRPRARVRGAPGGGRGAAEPRHPHADRVRRLAVARGGPSATSRPSAPTRRTPRAASNVDYLVPTTGSPTARRCTRRSSPRTGGTRSPASSRGCRSCIRSTRGTRCSRRSTTRPAPGPPRAPSASAGRASRSTRSSRPAATSCSGGRCRSMTSSCATLRSPATRS